MSHQTYIYHTARSQNFTSHKTHSIYHYFTATPDTQIAGIHINVSNTDNIILYLGEDASQDPLTQIVSQLTDTPNNLIAFDGTTFGDLPENRLVIGLSQFGANPPTINEISLYETMIMFPDGFWTTIVPTHRDRGGGVIELADGTLVQYKGYGRNKWHWKLGARFVDRKLLDQLDALYMERPEFFFAQEPDRYPERIHRCIIESPILRMPYTSQWKGNGYSIEMEIAEV